jgi:hypothetical protein
MAARCSHNYTRLPVWFNKWSKLIIALVVSFFVILAFSFHHSGREELTRHNNSDTRSKIIIDNDIENSFSLERGLSKTENYYIRKVVRDTWESSEYFFRGAKVEHSLLGSDQKPLPSMMVVSLVYDEGSYGKERTFEDFVKLIKDINYPPELLSFAILSSTKSEYDTILNYMENSDVHQYLKRAIVIYNGVDMDVSEDHRVGLGRKLPQVQKERRRLVARLRNFVVVQGLDDEKSVLWIDADIVKVPSNIVQDMASSEHDIVTARCHGIGDDPENVTDYDLNTWVGERRKPTEQEREGIAKGEFFKPRPVPDKTKFLSDYRSDPRKFVPVDSVGGTILYVNADVHRDGILFPTYYIIGTDWGQKEGYDGIETEGLCYQANTLGYSCWGMPHDIIWHDRPPGPLQHVAFFLGLTH